MKKGLYNIAVDGAWGSCGKGLVTGYLAWKYRPQILGTTNMANAGHTCVDAPSPAYPEPRNFIAKALPSPAALNAWYQNYNPLVVVGPSAAFHLDRLFKEAEICGLDPSNLWIHKRAGVITQEHRDAEASLTTGTKHIGSTMQGCGTFSADKVMRRKELKLAGDYAELQQFMRPQVQSLHLMNMLKNGAMGLHEGSQGFSLDVNHGSHYPNCTSRQTTATQCLADMGLPVKCAGDIYLVIRPYPIRVGNVVENGQTVGFSGGCYDDQKEIDWQTVGESAGIPQDKIDELTVKELTTVTKRLRRVFTFSAEQLRQAAAINGATRIALNFANYISWGVYGVNTPDALDKKVWQFIHKIEDIAGIPVTLVGTGPRVDQVVEL